MFIPMKRQEQTTVFLTGIILLLIFTFTDLQISMAVATKPAIAKVLEITGEIPFTLLAASGCAMLIRFRNRQSLFKILPLWLAAVSYSCCLRPWADL